MGCTDVDRKICVNKVNVYDKRGPQFPAALLPLSWKNQIVFYLPSPSANRRRRSPGMPTRLRDAGPFGHASTGTGNKVAPSGEGQRARLPLGQGAKRLCLRDGRGPPRPLLGSPCHQGGSRPLSREAPLCPTKISACPPGRRAWAKGGPCRFYRGLSPSPLRGGRPGKGPGDVRFQVISTHTL